MQPPAFLQRSDGSPVGSTAPQTGGGGSGPSNERFVMSVGQVAVFIEERGGESIDGANVEEKGAHEAANKMQRRQELRIIGSRCGAMADGIERRGKAG